MFWVILVYFNVRNILPKSGTFRPGHSVYISMQWHSLLRQTVKSLKVSGSILVGVIGIFSVTSLTGSNRNEYQKYFL